MPSHQNELLRAARAVAKCQRHIRELKRKIKIEQSNLKLEKKHLKALADMTQDPDIAPMRLFAGDVGIKREKTTRPAQIVIPGDFPVQPVILGDKAIDPVTCGTCGLTWDDAIPTEYTPAPSARCSFESFHV